MNAPLYRNRTPSSAFEAALMIAADFALECDRCGDSKNAARWRNVIWQERLKAGLVGQAKPVSVATKQHSTQLPLM